jgi:epoxyqueuosine reductase QueG
MNNQNIIELVKNFWLESPKNKMTNEYGFAPESAIGMPMYGEPIIGFADATDPYFERLKKPEAIGEHHNTPAEWLPESKSIVSYFFPWSEDIKESNRKDAVHCSLEWTEARIEGEAFLVAVGEFLKAEIEKEGETSLIPSIDKRYGSGLYELDGKEEAHAKYRSNWSERHAAYACGLGTFGLHKGLLTSVGAAGRCGSIITTLKLEPTKRPYQGLYDYCTMCGDCVKNCPPEAISIKEGKNHEPCFVFMNGNRLEGQNVFVCGKCQVNVACGYGIPE